mmetsp:Transcript_12350/g.18509  ORF Transcript_12350/g.18509 Transcript_12350/m.18509 type:complete len:98 (+) Transcript_12350:23-316(+)
MTNAYETYLIEILKIIAPNLLLTPLGVVKNEVQSKQKNPKIRAKFSKKLRKIRLKFRSLSRSSRLGDTTANNINRTGPRYLRGNTLCRNTSFTVRER